jgi:AcrR family transcriptional regulator
MKRRALRSDGEATRARILEAAGELFAAAGYGEATSKAVALRADASLASINYHFGGRGGLYEAVLIEAHRRFVDVADLQSLARSDMPAATKLGLLIDHIVRKWHLRVLAREVLAPTSHIEVLFSAALLPKAEIVTRILGEVTAIPVGDPALTRCLVSAFAPFMLLLVGPRGGSSPLEDLLRAPPALIAAHMHRFAIAGLEAIGRDFAVQATRSAARPKPKP